MIETYIAFVIIFLVASLVNSIIRFAIWREDHGRTSSRVNAHYAHKFVKSLYFFPAAIVWPLALPYMIWRAGRWIYWQVRSDLAGG